MCPLYNLQVLGLLYDGAGIFMLGVPAAWRMVNEIKDCAVSGYRYNLNMARALCVGRIDIASGAIVLFIGFMLQFLGNVGFVLHSLIVGWLLALGSLVIVILYFVYARARLIETLFNHVQAALNRK